MTKTQPLQTSHKPTVQPQLTLIDHLHELRTRLFWIILALIFATSASYLIKDQIMAVVMQPLGGQQLVYLTPIGGFNFIFKVSMYFGLVVILPVVIYHLYRFLEPLMQKRRKRSVVFFIIASLLLALAGGSFAYFAGLPAALHFLTGFTVQNVSAMLTVDSYLAFVVTYILGFAALFQIPLVLLIINSIRPIPPRKLMSFQRFVILGAFIVAAIISPTPDATNQAILALPIIAMYQVGVLLVWLQSRAATRREQRQAAPPKLTTSLQQPINRPLSAAPINTTQASMNQLSAQTQKRHQSHASRPSRPVMDVAGPRPVRPLRPIRNAAAQITQQRPQPARTIAARPLTTQRPSIDGIVRRHPLSQVS